MGSWLASLPSTSLGWLAFIRIAVGLSMISNGLNKLGVRIEPGQNPPANWLTNAGPLTSILAGTANAPGGAINGPAIDPIYKAFLQGVVLPNVGLFAQLVTFGELLVGLSLTFGILTRLGGWGGAFLHLNFMLMKGLPVHGGYTDRLFFVLEAIMALTAAGYVLGLDGLLRTSLPSFLHPLMSPAPKEERPGGRVRERQTQLA